jgi:hypothetical protein
MDEETVEELTEKAERIMEDERLPTPDGLEEA